MTDYDTIWQRALNKALDAGKSWDEAVKEAYSIQSISKVEEPKTATIYKLASDEDTYSARKDTLQKRMEQIYLYGSLNAAKEGAKFIADSSGEIELGWKEIGDFAWVVELGDDTIRIERVEIEL